MSETARQNPTHKRSEGTPKEPRSRAQTGERLAIRRHGSGASGPGVCRLMFLDEAAPNPLEAWLAAGNRPVGEW
jgi:hypothetical protein